MMKRLFSTKNAGSAHGNPAAARNGRPRSPPPDIYAGYVDGSGSGLGSSFFDAGTGALPGQFQQQHDMHGAYLNANGVTAGSSAGVGHHYGSSGSNGSPSHTTGSYLNSVPASSVNGDDASLYGAAGIGAGLDKIPLPPSAPNGAPASYGQGYNGPSSPFPPRQMPPSAQAPVQAPNHTRHHSLPHRSLLSRRSKSPLPPATPGSSAALRTLPEMHTAPPPPHQHQQQQPPRQRVVHVKVSAEDIRETTYMLRQLYKMELQIYGQRYAIHRDDKARREEMRRKADLLREEIEDIVHTWSSTDSAGWTSEELQHVDYSMQLIGKLRALGSEAE